MIGRDVIVEVSGSIFVVVIPLWYLRAGIPHRTLGVSLNSAHDARLRPFENFCEFSSQPGSSSEQGAGLQADRDSLAQHFVEKRRRYELGPPYFFQILR